MRRTFYSFAAPVILIFALLANTLPMPGCGSKDPKKQFHDIAEAVKDISGGTRDVIKAVGEAFDKKLITIQQKDKLADMLIRISKGGQKGVATLAAIEASGVLELSPQQKVDLTKLLDDEVVGPFLDLITELGSLSPESSAAIRAAMSSLRVAVLLLASRVGRNDIEGLIIQKELTAWETKSSGYPFLPSLARMQYAVS